MIEVAEFDKYLDEPEICAAHGLERCRICKRLREDEAAIEREESRKEEEEC